jgi:hypothetical protein
MAARGADIGEEIDHRADADDGDQHRPGQRKGVDAGLPALAHAPELVCGQASEGDTACARKNPALAHHAASSLWRQSNVGLSSRSM